MSKATKQALRLFAVILLLTPVLAVLWLATSQTGLRWAFEYAKPYMPGEFKMAALEGRLIGPMTAKGIDYRQDGAHITLDQLTLDWSPATLFTANVTLRQLHAQSLNIELPESPTTNQPITLPEIRLPWRVALEDVVVDGLSLHQNGQDFSLQQIKLDATTLFSQLDIKQLSLRADRFELTINGGLQLSHDYPHDLAMHWQTTLPSTAVIKGVGRLQGDIKKTRVKQKLTGPVQLTLDAHLTNLLNHPQWQVKADAGVTDVSQLITTWPAANGKLQLSGTGDLTTATLSGTLKGDTPELGPFNGDFALQRLSDNSIWIDRLMLNAPLTDTRLQGRGQWLPGSDGGDLDVALAWQNLRWPLKGSAWFDSAIGSGWVVGNLQHYRAGLATDRPWPQAPPSDWYASADGTFDGLDFHSLRISTPQGEALTAKWFSRIKHL